MVAGSEDDAYRPVPPDREAGRHLQTCYIGGGDLPAAAGLVCGFLGCAMRPYNPLLASLPERLVVRAGAAGWIRDFADQVVAASQSTLPASDALLVRMAEAMFIEVVRQHVAGLPATGTGWLAGLGDGVVGRALACLHDDPARSWTLDSLARSSFSSRSVLAQRFTHLVGMPPMQYLTRWRIHVAAIELTHGTSRIAAIAARSGYRSEAAFSRAFKRECGVSPAEWRQLQRARQTPTQDDEP